MRVYKFRAWNKKWKAMEPWGILKNKIVGRDFNDDNLVIMQWTGQIDNKGKEIYEGDIIKNNPDLEDGIIIWHQNKWMIRTSRTRKYRGEEYSETTYSELNIDTSDRRWGCMVVGNVFENGNLDKEV